MFAWIYPQFRKFCFPYMLVLCLINFCLFSFVYLPPFMVYVFVSEVSECLCDLISFSMVSNVWEEIESTASYFLADESVCRFPFLSSQISYWFQLMSSLILYFLPVFVLQSTQFLLFRIYFPDSVSLVFGSWSCAWNTDMSIVKIWVYILLLIQ